MGKQNKVGIFGYYISPKLIRLTAYSAYLLIIIGFLVSVYFARGYSLQGDVIPAILILGGALVVGLLLFLLISIWAERQLLVWDVASHFLSVVKKRSISIVIDDEESIT